MSTQQINISFADLTHTGHSCNAIPYGIALVASYALKNLGNKIEVDIFKYPNDLIEYLNRTTPKVACFSNFIWNINLSYEFAKQIKRKSPDTIIIFGGPNYPLETEQQKTFLHSHTDIDFYIYREGELAFLELYNKLLEYNFYVSELKQGQLNIPSCHYIYDGNFVKGDLLSPLADLNEIPSPYLSSLCDKFLDKELIPLVQTTRGCPFKCTFCQEGDPYFNNIRRFCSKRVKDEIEYIAQHTIVPNLMLSDSNFGMYKEDLEICRGIALIQEKYGWPKYFLGIAGKNQKDRVLEAASIVKGSYLSAAIQSTDEQVLKNIKRQNVSLTQMIQVTKAGEDFGAKSISEVILCLPGDTKKAHFEAISKLIDALINVVRSHQFIMLPGSEVSTERSRQQYGMITRFRVIPNTIRPYQLFGNTYVMPEIDEICVANNTMPFEDYLECRQFNLTVEIFYNDAIFQELLKFLKQRDISISSFIINIHKRIRFTDGPLSDLYDNFLRETMELWESRDELMGFLRRPGTADRYISGELGNNEQLMYRALAIFKHMDDAHGVVFDIAREMLMEKGCFGDQDGHYLSELFEFSLLRKKDIFTVDANTKKLFYYDFVKLVACNFNDDPLTYYKSEGVNIVFAHTDEQKELISKYTKIYSLTNSGLGHILSHASYISNLYRKVCII